MRTKSSSAAARQQAATQDQRLDALAARGSRLKSVPDLPIDRKRFLKLYYAQVAPEDLSEDPEALAAAALDHLAWARTRRRGTPKIRAFNPTAEENGWTSRHTIVELVNDDMPFLVDSVTMTLDTLGHQIHITIHPILRVERDGRGVLTGLGGGRDADSARVRTESFILIEISRQTDPKVLRGIETELGRTLRDVRLAVSDWPAMLEQLRDATDELREAKGPPPDLQRESCDFLEWLANDHFTLLGYREYELERGRSEDVLRIVEGTGLGILRERGKLPPPSVLTGPARAEARSVNPLVITKANTRSRVHRPALLDYVSVKVYDERRRPWRERRFLGLFTSSAYSEMPRDIPLLRLKAERLLELADVDPRSHRGKMLQHIIDTFPRDDLFQASIDELAQITNGILALQERRRIRLFTRRDPFGRFYSCLVYLPRERYSGRARRRIEQILLDGLRGKSVEAAVTISESALARLEVNVRTDPATPVVRNTDKLESQIEAAIVGWQDRLRDELLERLPENEALALYNRFAERFSAGYREEVSPERASEDMTKIARVADGDSPLEMALFQPEGPGRRLRFSTFSPERIPLYVALQILENMGLKVLGEQVYSARPEGAQVWIQEFDVELRAEQPVDAAELSERFMECFDRVLSGDVDNDGFNSFVVLAGIGWRDAVVLRAYGKYLAQTGLRFSLAYVQEVLARYPLLAATLVARFRTLFDPALSVAERTSEDERHQKVLKAELGRISNLDEDRILRAFAAAVNATLRTNFFQTGADGEPKPYLSFKLDSLKVADLPKPRPMFEIFVYSQRMEGVHLRMSRVARGGIRWSDRREDFRTEVLGLMKAQQVKNTVIVPNGAKGGFVCKQLPTGDREAQQREVVDCYKSFIRGLLDVTDNIVDDRIVKPPQIVTRDADDPYLVVAADKGTAAFSDIANDLAAEYDFWLGDAFASGGSAGYDHKEMGITARGGWESVKRHFREIGLDTQKQPFTVVGIGDMSGDVFGNGMLRSPHIRLVAAFDHRHIFIDPDPDPAVGFAERQRLFELPRSTWDDYDRSKLSKGGGIYSRQTKAIRLHPAAREVLGLDTDTVTPPELIRAVLTADVDLLWNGGIGTYVKASDESHQSARDPTNDAVRVDGRDLKCRVVGEGGNLGFTQLGRIEYALKGGRINTDFIDNSGGVDSSDREVNIKILLNAAVTRGELTRPRRNRLLASMTDEVAELVLQNNYGQTQALSMMSARALERLGEHQRLIRVLEAQGLLDRAVEFLPSDEEIEERRKAGRGLTRPELAIVLSYSKIQLTASLVDSDIPDDAYCAKELELYFPKVLQQRYEPLIRQHRLRREIVAMLLSGSMINRMGPFFVLRAKDEVGADAAQVARAYSIVREVFGLRTLWRGIEALDYQVPADEQYASMFQISRMARRAVYWFLQRYPKDLDIVPAIERFKPGVARVQESLAKVLSGSAEQRYQADLAGFGEAGLPRQVAKQIASLAVMTQLLEIARIADERRIDPLDVARAHFELGARLRLDWIRERIEGLKVDNYWQALARGQLLETLTREHRDVLVRIVEAARGGDLKEASDAWLAGTSDRIARVQNIIDDMRAAGVVDFATLTVALREIERLQRV